MNSKTTLLNGLKGMQLQAKIVGTPNQEIDQEALRQARTLIKENKRGAKVTLLYIEDTQLTIPDIDADHFLFWCAENGFYLTNLV